MNKFASSLQGKNDQTIGLLASFVGQMFYGLSFLFTSVAQQTASPDVQLALRFSISFIIMSFMLLNKKNRTSLKGRPILPLVVITLFVVAIYYLESLGVYYSNSSFASLVLSIMPVISLVGAAIFLKEHPTRRQVIFSFCPVIGVILITLANSDMGVVGPIGIAVMILCCLVSCTSRILCRKYANDYSTFERSYATLFAGSVCFSITALNSVSWDVGAFLYPLTQPSFLASTLALCVLCSVVGQILVNFSYSKLPVVKLSAMSTLSTVIGVLAGIFILHEPVNALSLTGSALTLFGIWQVNRPDKEKA
ncbi:MAG: DMT family transporter [Ruminococcaceae bacterium]|nr:DMT family transporter [Oscillospiraceae bacterium]